MYCRHCGNEIDEKAEICTKCGVRIRVSIAVNPATAAILSAFIPGVGQFYNREVWKGTTFLLAILTLFIITIGAIYAQYIKFGIITGGMLVILWILNAYDAYRVAMKINTI
jgi:TM2 domain-containing membrane protein YozV